MSIFMDKGCMKGRNAMKTRMMSLMTLAMSITVGTMFASSVYAGVFDDYVDYLNPDGTYAYYFDQGVLVTLDEHWYQHTSTESEDDDTNSKLGKKWYPEQNRKAGLQLETDPNKEHELKLEPDHLDMLVSLDGEEDEYYEELILTANGKKVPSSKVRWESDHPEIADVDELGWVTSMGIGTATITAYYGGEKQKCTVHVTQKITTDTVIVYEES